MEAFTRYAIYYAPEPEPLASFGAQWLGWDAETGTPTAPLQLPGLPAPVEQITATPRKYGFHGTIKPPFRLAQGTTVDALHDATQALARLLPPARMSGLALSQLGHFLALTPVGPTTELAALASLIVRELDHFRDPPTDTELARRRPEALSPAQRALLTQWGYPYVMEEFRPHLTLTGRLSAPDLAQTHAALAPVLTPILPAPFEVRSLCLFGEDAEGRFRNLHRYTLSG